MILSKAMRKKIKMLLKERDWKPWDLCKVTGIPCSTLTTFLNGKTLLLKIDTLLYVCEGFNITLADFFSDPLFKDVNAD